MGEAAAKKAKGQHTECKQESNIAVIFQKQESIEEKIDRIDKAVSGNGKLGMRQRLDRIQGGLIVVYVLFIILAGVLSVSII